MRPSKSVSKQKVKDCVTEYHEKLQAGEIIAGHKVMRLYCGLVEDMKTWDYDTEAGYRVIEFIETFCMLSDGEMGQPLILELFQKAAIQAIFGFKNADGHRRFREVMWLMGRKNGKSQLLSAIALYMLMADGEASANVFSAATKRDQSMLTFDAATKMVKQSPTLSKHITKRKTDLYFPLTFSKFEPLASEARTLEGLNSHCIIIDEVHSLQTRAVYDVLKRSTAAKSRKQPLLFMITTAGTVRESIYDEMYKYSVDVLNGIIEDESFFPLLYELDEREEWTNEAMWIKANPGLDVIKSIEYLRREVEKAKNDNLNLSELLCKDFNLPQTQVGSWLTYEVINNTETYNLDDLKNCYAIGGVDLSSTTDLTAAKLLVMKPNDPKKYIISQYFIPSEVMEKKIKEDKVPYDVWESRGLVTVTPGNTVDYSFVTQWFLSMYRDKGIIPMWIGYDPWNSTYWVQEMKDTGFTMELVRQGAQTFSSPAKMMAGDLADKLINYNNNSIDKWCLTNTNIKRDENDNIRPVKKENQKLRIDGTLALLNCYVVLLNHYQDYQNII